MAKMSRRMSLFTTALRARGRSSVALPLGARLRAARPDQEEDRGAQDDDCAQEPDHPGGRGETAPGEPTGIGIGGEEEQVHAGTSYTQGRRRATGRRREGAWASTPK